MIKLIATDLDNTLLDAQGTIPESTAALLRQAGEQGVRTAVATGRCYPSALAAARAIGAQTPAEIAVSIAAELIAVRAGKG